MSPTSQKKTSILLETSYYDLNSGEFNTPPETYRFWGHKWPCLVASGVKLTPSENVNEKE